jgi:hypothetical protein
MTGQPSAQDVADALGMTLEREDPSGAPWCPPTDGIAVRRWVSDRSASLGTGLRRVVRLARLMALADGRDYVRFLYVRLSSLRGRLFRHALETAAAEGRVQRSVATLSDRGVVLREAALAPQAGKHDGFEIDFAQMPRLAALLDVLHNALGFTVVADLLAPLLQPGTPARHADEVARALQAALNAWLSERLESANHMLQAQRIRAFLASRGHVAPESVDDEGILLFWIMMAESPDDERIDGFRLYRSVAAAMLRYRGALRDAATARHLEEALGRGLEPANDEPAIDHGHAKFEPWRSPLRALALPPASRVKWLTAKEQRALLNYLGGPADEVEDEEGTDSENATDAWKGSLAGDERFDLGFCLTLLRADVFGALQASIVARLRKRAAASEAVAQVMGQLDDAAYAKSAATYAELRAQLQLESLAALSVLMEVGAAEALILLNALGGQQAVRSVIGSRARGKSSTDEDETEENDMAADDTADDTAANELRKEVAPALQAAIADPSKLPDGPARKLLLDAVVATRKVSRAGFRREDRADTEMIAALRSGATAVFEVMRELDRLTNVLSEKAPASNVAGDSARFHAAFRRFYISDAADH